MESFLATWKICMVLDKRIHIILVRLFILIIICFGWHHFNDGAMIWKFFGIQIDTDKIYFLQRRIQLNQKTVFTILKHRQIYTYPNTLIG